MRMGSGRIDMIDMIPAEAHSDDFVFEVKFDATKWFDQANEQQLLALIACGFGGDYPADEVAIDTAKQNEELAHLFVYLNALFGTRKSCGFECFVDEVAALLWLKKHRPYVVDLSLRMESDT